MSEAQAAETAQDRSILEVRGLTIGVRHGRERRVIVDDISFDVAAGEWLGIVGESGSGKSMVLKAIMGLLPPNIEVFSGRIVFDGVDLVQLPVSERRARLGKDVSMIFQEPMTALNPTMKVGEQIAQGPMLHQGMSHRQALERAIELMEKTGIPEARRRAEAYPAQLSGGLRQRVMIAIALACSPRLVLCDEPTTALDVTVQAQVLDLIDSLCDSLGASVVFVTHDLPVIVQTCERVTVMYGGRILESGELPDTFEHPRHPYTRGLIASAPDFDDPDRALVSIDDRVRALAAYTVEELEAVAPDELVPHDEPSTAAKAPVPADTSNRPIALRVRGLRKTYRLRGVPRRDPGRTFVALDDVDVELHRGEILVVVGESGSGKTTLGSIICGAIDPDSGEMEYDGRELGKRRTEQDRRAIQLVFQDPYSSLNPRLTIYAMLAELLRVHRIVPPEEIRAECVRLMQIVGLDEDALDAYPGQFSGGQRQRIAIARALAVRPDVIVADEPVSALDVSVQATVLNLLRGLCVELNLSILFITHNFAVVRAIAERVMVMREGRVIESGQAEDILERPQQEYTRQLIESIPRMSRNEHLVEENEENEEQDR